MSMLAPPLTAVVDGVGHDGLEGAGESSVAVLQEGGELEPHDVQVHHFPELFGLLQHAILLGV